MSDTPQIAGTVYLGGKIFKAIPAIMSKVGAIAKTKRNGSELKYAFRGIDDVYNAIHDLLADNGVFFVPTVLEHAHIERGKTKSGTTMHAAILKVKFTFYADDGSSFDAVTIGEAMDTSDKSSNKAHSGAVKNALLQVFCIQTEDLAAEDQDNDTPEAHRQAPKRGGENAKPAGQRPAPPAAPPGNGNSVFNPLSDDRAFSDQLKAAFDAGEWSEASRRHCVQHVLNTRKLKRLVDLSAKDRQDLIAGIKSGQADNLKLENDPKVQAVQDELGGTVVGVGS